ncbi:hypothetical protein GCM10020218_104590 [Dactylosporangium vinaceum]
MTIGEERDTASLSVTADAAGGDTVVLTVSGEVDYETAPELRAAVLGAIEPHPAGVVLDLAGLRFMDSSGLGVIVGGWQRAQQADVRYVLRRVPPGDRRAVRDDRARQGFHVRGRSGRRERGLTFPSANSGMVRWVSGPIATA